MKDGVIQVLIGNKVPNFKFFVEYEVNWSSMNTSALYIVSLAVNVESKIEEIAACSELMARRCL